MQLFELYVELHMNFGTHHVVMVFNALYHRAHDMHINLTILTYGPMNYFSNVPTKALKESVVNSHV